MKPASLLFGLVFLSVGLGWYVSRGGDLPERSLTTPSPRANGGTDPRATEESAQHGEGDWARESLTPSLPSSSTSSAGSSASIRPGPGPENDSAKSSFRVQGLVLARDGTPLPGVRLYAFRTQDLLDAGVVPQQFDWERGRHLLGRTKEQVKRTLQAESDEHGAFVLSGGSAIQRTLIARPVFGASGPAILLEPDHPPVVLRMNLCRIVVRLHGAERIPSRRSVHLLVRPKKDRGLMPNAHVFDENWQITWLEPPGCSLWLDLQPGTPLDRGRRSLLSRLPSNPCSEPRSMTLELAGLRVVQEVSIPSSASFHEISLALPPRRPLTQLDLHLEQPDRSEYWRVRLLELPDIHSSSGSCLEQVFGPGCFPVSLELPEGDYSLRYAPVAAPTRKRPLHSNPTRPETWTHLELNGKESQVELLRLVESAKVRFVCEFSSRSAQKLDWVETSHMASGGARHEVLLVSPSGEEKDGVMNFHNGGRGEDSVILRGIPLREFEVGTWSFFMSDASLGTLSTEFEVLPGQENIITLTGQLP